MTILWTVAILAIWAAAPKEERCPGAQEVYSCAFDQLSDRNFDGWPDGWTRRRGPGFPQYLPVEIVTEPSPTGPHCMRIELDGGGAVAQTPSIHVSPLYDYYAECYVRTEGLRDDRAFLSLAFFDKSRVRLETYVSERVHETSGWTRLRLGPISPRHEQIDAAVIGLHLEPTDRADLKGSARFAGVWMGRLPRVTLSTGNPLQLFTLTDSILLTCQASGYTDAKAAVHFCLRDVRGRSLATEQQLLATRKVGLVGDDASGSHEEPPLAGLAEWKPPITEAGYYGLEATLISAGQPASQRRLSLAVIDAERTPAASEFGWTLPRGDRPLAIEPLCRLVSQAGISRVKYPLWCDETDFETQIDKLIRLSDYLLGQEIELVGLLQRPPDGLRTRLDCSTTAAAAEIFTASPKIWYPSVESVMARMATQVRWWQLGGDEDTSFAGYPRLAERITEVKSQLDRIGHNVNVGFGWPWAMELPQAPGGREPWRFLALSADPPLTARELAAALSAAKQATAARWVVLEPLPVGEYSPDDRAIDLVERMMAAKIHGADAIFITDPFSNSRGLLHDDGTPGQLLLPWRTTALRLGGAAHLGSIELPGGSRNEIFTRDNQTTMVVWGERPCRESLSLGEGVRQVDLWGRTTPLSVEKGCQVVDVERMPKFLVGLDPALVRWRHDFTLANTRLPSLLGTRQPNRVRLTNPLERGASGRLEMFGPEGWRIEPKQMVFRLAAGESQQQPLEITLPEDADCGTYRLRAELEIQGERTTRFSIYRSVEIGTDDVDVELSPRFDARDVLAIEQQTTNRTDAPARFRCLLFIPDRPRMKTDVIVGAHSTDVQTYRLSEGRLLAGKTLWMHAEEVDGPRVLNVRVKISDY